MSSVREAAIEAQWTGAVRHQRQKAAGDRDVLEEHHHLDLVAEIGVEYQCPQMICCARVTHYLYSSPL